MKVGQPSFTSGELDPSLHARADLALYRTGLDTCYNYMVMPQGGARNRPGLAYIGATKDNLVTRLIPFAYNDDDSYLLEFTANRMRVYRNGGLVLLDGTQPAWSNGTDYVQGDIVDYPNGVYYSCYTAHTSATGLNRPGDGSSWTDYWIALTDDEFEMYHPYTAAELAVLDFEQNADTIILVHYSHEPAKLLRSAHDAWTLTDLTYSPAQPAPTALSGSGGAGTSYNYVVTAVNAETLEESLPCTSAVNLEDGGTLTWTDATGAGKYNIYKEEQGIYGFIGVSSDGTTGFKDSKLIALTDDTPPSERDPFASTSQKPTCVAFHEQRLVFGGSEPQKISTSQTGNYFNFSVSEPANDSDALDLDIVTNKIATIRYLVSQIDLLVFTAGAESRVTSGDNGFALSNLRRKQQSSYGCAIGIKPQIVGDKILFVQRGGKNVRDFAYSFEADKFTGGDLSVVAKHLFESNAVQRWAFANEPYPIMWMVMADGTLVGMTIASEHEVLAFHKHETDGVVEDIVALPEGDSTSVYMVVQRTVNSATVRYIEKMVEWNFATIADAKFLDSHLTGTITGSTISGLDHLEGETVTAFIGGDVDSDLVVSSGQITLSNTYTSATACVGLPYTARLKTLEPPIQDAYGNELSVSRLQMKVLDTRGLWAGPDENNMVELPPRDLEAWGDPTSTKTGNIEIVIEPTWDNRGQVVVEQRDPLPSFILSMTPDVEAGG